MGFLSRIFGLEQRGQAVRASDPYLGQFFGMGGPVGNVTPDNVLSNLAVAARCVALRSELLASVGLFLYRRTSDGGRERANDNPLYVVLHDMFNPNMTAFEGREFLVRSLDLSGNAYARIERNARGQVTALHPLAPMTVAVERLPSGRLRYKVSDGRGGTLTLVQEEILHIRGPSRDGVLGLSPIQIARGALALVLSQNETASSLMSNSLRASGVLSFPERFGAEAKDRIRRGIEQNFTGESNSGRVLILDGGAKFERMSFTPQDAEFLASRKVGNEDVARVFGLPPTSVGITDKATYSNTEQEGRALVQNAIGPLAKRIEAALARCLLSDASRRTYYIEHDLDALLRGDVQARFEAYRIAREIGAFSPNDIRRKENEPPIPNGDTYHQPANWIPLGTSAQAAPENG